MNPKRICLITNYNQYESKRVFTAELAKALDECGIATLILDWAKSKSTFFKQIQDFKPDLLLSFNSFQPLSNGEYIWDILKIPTLFVIVDPVIYYANIPPSPYLYLSCVDRNDAQMLADNGYTNVFFWPHATSTKPLTYEERIYDVVLTGSCYDYESLKESAPPQLLPILDAATELVLGPNCISIAQAIHSTWHLANLPQQEIDFKQLFYLIDYYTRGLDRINLVKSLKDCKVHIFGELGQDHPSAKKSWDYYLGNLPNITLHPALNFSDALKIQRQAKICLNSMPFFKNGSHERILTSLEAGALPLTSDSIWTHEQFSHLNDILIYTPNSYSHLNELIQNLLSNPQQLQTLISNGRQKVISHHTWISRARGLCPLDPCQRAKPFGNRFPPSGQ
ncbi:MAG: glycosyltransferase [Parachlamydiales bacterium]|jgi:glycosyltransferase involved in cell wall biosynthesis